MTERDYRYKAFISYRHADNKEPGRQWATWLHQAIETYEVPVELVGKTNGRGEKIQSRIFPIFRDEEELPANADLGNSIASALDSTSVLIVLCSPRAVASTYVAEEIEYFKKLGRSDRIIAAIIDGEPNASWDEEKLAGTFTPEDECFPLPLQFEYDKQGNRTQKRAEPIAADFRINNKGTIEQAWTSIEAYRQHLKVKQQKPKNEVEDKAESYQKQQRLMLLKIIAGVLGVPLGELTQRDKEYQFELERQKTKKLRRWLSVVAILSVIAIGAGITATFKQKEAEEQRLVAQANERKASSERDQALKNQSYFLLDAARQNNEDGFFDKAMLLSLNAIPGIYGGNRPIVEKGHFLREAISKNKKISELGLTEHAIFSPDGKFILTAKEREVTLLSSKNGQLLKTFTTTSPVKTITFSPNSKIIAITSDDVKLFSTASGQQLQALVHDVVESLFCVFSPNNEIIVTAAGKQVALWSQESGKQKQLLELEGTAVFAKFSPNGEVLATVSSNDEVALWEVATAKKLHSIPLQIMNSMTNQNIIDFSIDSKRIVITGMNPSMWSIDTGQKVFSLSEDDLDVAISADFSPQGDSVVIAYNSLTESKAIIWGLNFGDKKGEFSHQGAVQSAVFSADGNTLLTASDDKTSAVWDISSGEKLHSYSHEGIVKFAAFDAKNKNILTLSAKDEVDLLETKATLWSLKDMENRRVFKHGGGDIAISHDGNHLVTSSKTRNAVIWSLKNDDSIAKLDIPYGPNAIIFSPDDQFIVTADRKEVKIWSVKSGQIHQTFKHRNVIDLSFSNDGHLLVSRSENIVAVWSLKDGDYNQILKLKGKMILANLSPNNKQLMTASADVLELWSLESSEKLLAIPAEYEITDAAFNHDGTKMVVSSSSTRIYSVSTGERIIELGSRLTFHRLYYHLNSNLLLTLDHSPKATLWNTQTGHRIRDFVHNGLWVSVENATISADGKLLATIDSTNIIIIWDINTGEKLKVLEFELGNLNIAFTPDSQFLITGTDTQATLWPLYRTNLASAAISMLPKNRTCLTPSERQLHFLSNLEDLDWHKRQCPQYSKAKQATEQLYSAVSNDNLQLVKQLLAQGGDVNFVSSSEWHKSPLVIAASKLNKLMIKALIEAGADISIPGALHAAVVSGAIEHEEQDLPFVPDDKNAEIAQYLLDMGVDIDQEVDGINTALLFSIQYNRPTVFKVLLNHGADVNKANSQGVLPIEMAIQKGHVDMVQQLILKSANTSLMTSNGESMLETAIKLEHIKLEDKEKIIALLKANLGG